MLWKNLLRSGLGLCLTLGSVLPALAADKPAQALPGGTAGSPVDKPRGERQAPFIPPPLLGDEDVLLEQLEVLTLGPEVQTQALEDGVAYLLLARGAVSLGPCQGSQCPGRPGKVREGDAAYATGDGWRSAGPASGRAPGGLAIDGVVPDWGTFRPDHVYALPVTGTGAPLSLRFLDGDGQAMEAGRLEVSLYQVGGGPLSEGTLPRLPEVFQEEARHASPVAGQSASACAVMAAAGAGKLPCWLEQAGATLQACADLATADDASGAEAEAGPGVKSQLGSYLTLAFHLPGQADFSVSRSLAGDTSCAGVCGALGDEAEAGPALAGTLEGLGAQLMGGLPPRDQPYSLTEVGTALETAAAAGQPTLVQLTADGARRFVVMRAYERYARRLELLVWDPARSPSAGETGETRYRVMELGAEPVLEDDVPVVDGVLGLWSLAPLEARSRVDLILDDGVEDVFRLTGQELRWGRVFDHGLGAPGVDQGVGAWGLTWVQARGARKPLGEAQWRLVDVPRSSPYQLWMHVPESLSPQELASPLEVYLDRTEQGPLTSARLVGEVRLEGQEASAGWHQVGEVALEAGETIYIRVPLVGPRDRRLVLDAIRLTSLESMEK